MGFTIDTILDVASPLTGPRLSPAVAVLLAYAVQPGQVGDALWQLRHGQSITKPTQPYTRLQAVRDVVRSVFEALMSNRALRAFALISLVRAINRLGAHLIVDRQFPRRIDWPRHTVVITGGARGIAGRMAELLKDKGATVAVLDMAEKSDHGREDLFIKTDVLDEKNLLDARAKVRAELGYPTMLISAAGIARHSFVLDPPAVFPSAFSNKVQNVNLDGTINFVRVFGQDMLSDYDEHLETVQAKNGSLDKTTQLRKEGKNPPRNNWGGHILLIGSGAAFVALPGNANYNASKAGVISLHQTLGWELDVWHKAKNVRNSVFCPLMINSPMTEGRMKAQRDQFLTPTLSIDQAAKRAIKILEEDRSTMTFMPRAAYFLSLVVPNFPPWLVRIIAKSSGAHETFVEYTAQTRTAIPQK